MNSDWTATYAYDGATLVAWNRGELPNPRVTVSHEMMDVETLTVRLFPTKGLSFLRVQSRGWWHGLDVTIEPGIEGAARVSGRAARRELESLGLESHDNSGLFIADVTERDQFLDVRRSRDVQPRLSLEANDIEAGPVALTSHGYVPLAGLGVHPVMGDEVEAAWMDRDGREVLAGTVRGLEWHRVLATYEGLPAEVWHDEGDHSWIVVPQIAASRLVGFAPLVRVSENAGQEWAIGRVVRREVERGAVYVHHWADEVPRFIMQGAYASFRGSVFPVDPRNGDAGVPPADGSTQLQIREVVPDLPLGVLPVFRGRRWPRVEQDKLSGAIEVSSRATAWGHDVKIAAPYAEWLSGSIVTVRGRGATPAPFQTSDGFAVSPRQAGDDKWIARGRYIDLDDVRTELVT